MKHRSIGVGTEASAKCANCQRQLNRITSNQKAAVEVTPSATLWLCAGAVIA